MRLNRIGRWVVVCAWLYRLSHSLAVVPTNPFATTEKVGVGGSGHYFTPANQVLTPAGLQVELPGMRAQAIALSPDGRLLVTAGKTHDLLVLEPTSGKILQRVPLPSNDDSDPAPAVVSDQMLNPDK